MASLQEVEFNKSNYTQEQLEKDTVELLEKDPFIYLADDIWNYFESFHSYRPKNLPFNIKKQKLFFLGVCPEKVHKLIINSREFYYLKKYEKYNSLLKNKVIENWKSIATEFKKKGKNLKKNSEIRQVEFSEINIPPEKVIYSNKNDESLNESVDRFYLNDVIPSKSDVIIPNSDVIIPNSDVIIPNSDVIITTSSVVNQKSDLIMQKSDTNIKKNKVTMKFSDESSPVICQVAKTDEKKVHEKIFQVQVNIKAEENLSFEEHKSMVESLLEPKKFAFPISQLTTPLYCNKTDFQKVDKEMLNRLAESCISQLVEDKQHVCPETVAMKLFEVCKVKSLSDLNVRNIGDIKCINELGRLLNRVNLTVQTYVNARAVCTLYELDLCLRGILCDNAKLKEPNRFPHLQKKEESYTRRLMKLTFDDLRLGPFTCLPLVYEYFKLPPGHEVFKITSDDVLNRLLHFLQQGKWNAVVTLEMFMEDLVKKTKVSDPYLLGIRISSLPLAIQAVKKAARDKSQMTKDVIAEQHKDLTSELKVAFDNFKHFVIYAKPSSHNEGTVILRQELFDLDARQLLDGLMSRLVFLFQKCEELVHGKDAKNQQQRYSLVLSDLKRILLQDDATCSLFKIALCFHNYRLLEDEVMRVFSSMKQQKSQGSNAPTSKKNKGQKQLVAANQLEDRLVRLILRTYHENEETLTLHHLCAIEIALTLELKAQTFAELSGKSFLEFVTNNRGTMKQLNSLTGTSLGTSSSSSPSVTCSSSSSFSLLLPSLLEMEDFMKQCQHFGAEHFKNALCHHYRISDVSVFHSFDHLKEYACFLEADENIKNVVKKSNKKNSNEVSKANMNVVYEEALLGKKFNGLSKVGLLGSVTEWHALVCLHNCPLLCDMHHFSNWKVVFEPQFGDLKTFVLEKGGVRAGLSDVVVVMTGGTMGSVDGKMHGTADTARQEFRSVDAMMGDARKLNKANLEIVALEVKPGELLKLAFSSGSEAFYQAVLQEDAHATSGHLVSSIVLNGGLDFFSDGVFATKLKSGLLGTYLRDTNDVTNESLYVRKVKRNGEKEMVEFVLECMCCMPAQLAPLVISKVFLETLDELMGKSKSKSMLKEAAGGKMEKLNYLEYLGLSLGIPEWYEGNFQEKLMLRVPFEKEENHREVDQFNGEKNDKMEVLTKGDGEEKKVSGESNKAPTDVSEETDECSGKEVSSDIDLNLVQSISKISLENDKAGEVAENNEASLEGKTEETSKQTVEEGGVQVVETSFDPDDSKHWEALVNKIRMEEFGVGIHLEGQGKVLLGKQEDRLCRSLERLAADLYSTNTHFVLELVQNADDNVYHEGSTPSLLFKVGLDDIVLCNNEVGFRQKDLKAICDVGRTTKGKHKAGYIGQKGIGFKSVFRITDTPQIFSRGLSVMFDVNSKPLGYILPYWISDAVAVSDSVLRGDSQNACGESGEDAVENAGGENEKVEGKEGNIAGENKSFEDGTDATMMNFEVQNKGEKEMVERQKLIGRSEDQKRYRTRIRLPLKDVVKEDKAMRNSFNDLHPSLLLFLNRLKQIVVMDEVSGVSRSMSRRDIGDNMVEISDGEKVKQWVVIKKVIDATEVCKEAKSMVDIQSTELAMAFPVFDSSSQNLMPPKQPVFAFLPLRSYGFRFIVQGDFDVPSSREDVNDSLWNQWLRSKLPMVFIDAIEYFKTRGGDKPQEEVCRFFRFLPQPDEVLDFFKPVSLQILNSLKATDCLPSAEGVWCLPSQLLMCLDPVVLQNFNPKVIHSLTGLNYLDPYFVRNLSHSILLQLGVQRLNYKHLLQIGKLLCKNFNDDFEKNGSISDNAIESFCTWVACLYRHCMHENLGDVVVSPLKEFLTLPLSNGKVIRICELTESQSVFFPFNAAPQSKKKANKNSKFGSFREEMMATLEKDLDTVDRRLSMRLADGSLAAHVMWMLEKVGVKEMVPSDLVKHHILPCLRNPGNVKSPKVYIAYTLLLKDMFTIHASTIPMKELACNLPIVTNKGLKIASLDAIHFTHEYDNKLQLNRQFPCYDWILLEPFYLGSDKSKTNVASWRDFFAALGVRDFLCIKQQNVIIDSSDEVSKEYKDAMQEFQSNESKFLVTDFSCIELYSIINTCIETNDKNSYQQLKFLFEILNFYWTIDSKAENTDTTVLSISAYLRAKMSVHREATDAEEEENEHERRSNNSRTMRVIDFPSSLGVFLRTKKWIPILKIHPARKEEKLFEKRRNVVENKTFIDRISQMSELALGEVTQSPCIVGLTEYLFWNLGHHVDYSTIPEEHLNVEMAHFLNIKTYRHSSIIIQAFVSWCSRFVENNFYQHNETASNEPVKFVDSYERISRIYDYINENVNKSDLNEILAKYPVIFVRDPSENKTRVAPDTFKDIGEGRFVRTEVVCWSDETGLLNKYSKEISQLKEFSIPVILSAFYPAASENFFTDSCRVKKKPDFLVYLDVLKHITSNHVVSQETRGDVKVIFSLIGRYLKNLGEDAHEECLSKVKKSLEGLKIFPSKSNKWVSVYDQVALIDDPVLETLFELNSEVHMISLYEQESILSESRSSQSSGVSRFANVFMKLFGVKGLTELVTIETVTEVYNTSKYLRDYFASMLPYVQKYLLSHFPVTHRYLEEDFNIKQKLQELNFAQVSKLQLVYHLTWPSFDRQRPGERIATETIEKPCKIHDSTFYVRQTSLEEFLELNKEISIYFSFHGRSCDNINVKMRSEMCFKDLRSLLIQVSTMMWSKNFEMLDGLLQAHNCTATPEFEWTVPDKLQYAVAPTLNFYKQEKSDKDDTESQHPEENAIRRWPPLSRKDGLSSINKNKEKTHTSSEKPSFQTHHYNFEEKQGKDQDGNEVEEVRTGVKGVYNRGNLKSDDNKDGGDNSGSRSDNAVDSNVTDDKKMKRDKGGKDADASGKAGKHRAVSKEGDANEAASTCDKGKKDESKNLMNEINKVSIKNNGNGYQGNQASDVCGNDAAKDNDETAGELSQKIIKGKNEAAAVEKETQGTNVKTKDNNNVSNNNVSNNNNVNCDVGGRSVIDDSAVPPSLAALADFNARKTGRTSSKSESNVDFNAYTELISMDVSGIKVLEEELMANTKAFDDFMPSNVEDKDLLAIGRLGELIVMKHLQELKEKENSQIAEVVHMNQDAFTVAPFDIKVRLTDDRDIYIEVKSTSSIDKRWFEISLQELSCAVEHNDNYHIYRVFGVGQEKIRLVKIENLRKSLNRDQLKLAVVLQ